MNESKLKNFLVAAALGLFFIITFGLLWLFFLAPRVPEGLGWFLFSFATGLSMIVLPCTLPLAFVIVPLSMGKGVAKGITTALAFGLGVALTLSIYGVLAAVLGGFATGALNSSVETVKNWVYFVAGIFAYLFALGQLGLLKFHMPSYTGAAPAFIQNQQDFIKAFLLGAFLGNIGVGCPHPATPLILIEIASSGDVLYGWLLFLTHAIGRVLPLILLAFLGIAGVNGLSWLVARKAKIERATGWAMVYVAGFILTLGLFTHDWWVNSGQHTLLESVTGEHGFLARINAQLGTAVTHAHGLEVGEGLFGLPLDLGNWFLVFLWIVPMLWWYLRRHDELKTIPETDTVPRKESEHRLLSVRGWFILALSLLLTTVFAYVLPQRFLQQQSGSLDHGGSSMMHMHEDGSEHDHGGDGEGGHGSEHGAIYQEVASVTEGPLVELALPITNPVVRKGVKPSPSITAGAPTPLQFSVSLLPERNPILNLDINHEKKMHVIGMREDLSNFFHIHPEEVAPGRYSVEHTFAEPGTYKMFSDVVYQGQPYSFGSQPIVVGGKLPTTTEIIDFGINKIVDEYQVSLYHNRPLGVGENKIVLLVTNLYGEGVPLGPYLGAPMHVAIIKDDLKTYVHTHPDSATPKDKADDGHDHEHTSLLSPKVAYAHGGEEGEHVDPTVQSFTVHFNEPGVYKIFAQFRPGDYFLPEDEYRLASFYVEVKDVQPGKEITPLAPGGLPWKMGTDGLLHYLEAEVEPESFSINLSQTTLIILSLIAMGLLSAGVRRYLGDEA